MDLKADNSTTARAAYLLLKPSKSITVLKCRDFQIAAKI